MQEKLDDYISGDIFSIEKDALYEALVVDKGRNLRFFDYSSLSSLSLVSTTMRYATIDEVKNRAKPLVQHVVYGEEEEAERMIKECPDLLYCKVQVVDYSGRTIVATAFHAALGAEDIRMCKMILKYIDKEAAMAQFNEQFPNGLEDKYNSNAEAAYDFSPIINAMINNSNDLEGLITKFRESVTANNEIKSGLHFNMQHLIAAYNAYVESWDDLKNSAPNYKNCDKFWVEIIGFIQRQMPANYAQAYCSGLNLLEDNPENFKRTLNLSNPNKYDSGHSFFPLLGVHGLGFNFAVFSYGRAVPFAGGAVAGCLLARPVHGVRKLCETKSNGLTELRDFFEQELGHKPALLQRYTIGFH